MAAGIVLVFASLGCNLLSPTPAAWSLTVTPPPGTPETATPPPIPSLPALNDTSTPRPPAPTGSAQLLTDSPWLVYCKSDGQTLVAWKVGDSQPVEIRLPAPLLVPSDLQNGASPTGAWLAVRTGKSDGSEQTLLLISLADQTTETITPLLSPELAAQAFPGRGEQLPEPVLAVQDSQAIRWSPDGRWLAYIAALDGPSADLYIYHLEEGNSIRLTRGTRQAATPFWSPDGKWILIQEVINFGSGAGWTVTTVWATAVDHNETRQLYAPPKESGGEIFLGWTSPETVASYTWTRMGGLQAREVPLNTRWLNLIYEGPFDIMAFDPASRWFIFTTGEPTSTQTGLTPGIYRLVADASPPEIIQAGEWRQVAWEPRPGVFTASGAQGALLFRPSGEANLFRGEGGAMPSPDGLWVAGWGDLRYNLNSGVRLYQPDGTLLEEVTQSSTQRLLWHPSSKTFFYQTGDQVYRVSFPDTRPVLLGEGAIENSFILIPTSP